MKIFRLIFSLLLFFTTYANAQIEWERKEVTLSVHPIQQKVAVEFKFHNTGNDPIEFLSLRPSCGCLSIYPQKKSYLPGESGILKVVFDLSNRIGPQEKKVMIVTSDAPKKEQILTLKVNIPEGYQLSTSRLIWKENQREPQTVTLTNVSGKPISLGKVTSSDPRIKATLKTIRSGFEYQIDLTPDPTVKNVRSVIRIETIPPTGMKESKGYRIYAHVK